MRTYLDAFPSRGENKALAFIRYLEDCPTISHGDMAELLYGNPKSKTLSSLKPKLEERMLELFHLSVNGDHQALAKADPASQIQLHLFKKLSYALTARMRGMHDLARELLQECVAEADDYGYSDIKLQALTLLRSLSRSEEEVTTRYSPAIDEALEAYVTELMGLSAMDEYDVRIELDHMPDEAALVAWLEERLTALEQRLQHHYSKRGHLFQLVLQENLCRYRGRFSEGRQVVQDWITLMEAHPGLKSRYREGLPYVHLADLELRCRNYPQAVQACDQARAVLYPGKRLYYRASLLKLLSHLYQGQWEAAQVVGDELGQIPYLPELENFIPIARYLRVCLIYLRGERREALRVLQRENPLQQDKPGWNVGLRLMEILVLVDLEEFDLASSRIESLRKHVSKYGVVDPRSEWVYRYLYQWERQSFDPQGITPKMKDLLREMVDHTTWNPIGYEVLRFESWVRAKTEGKPIEAVLLQDWRQP